MFDTLERTYGIKVVSEGHHYNPKKGKSIETFKIYTADGCPWENGLSKEGVKRECERWGGTMVEIWRSMQKEIAEKISEPYLVIEISEALETGASLTDVIKVIERAHPNYKFSQTTKMYESCIMAWFERK